MVAPKCSLLTWSPQVLDALDGISWKFFALFPQNTPSGAKGSMWIVFFSIVILAPLIFQPHFLSLTGPSRAPDLLALMPSTKMEYGISDFNGKSNVQKMNNSAPIDDPYGAPMVLIAVKAETQFNVELPIMQDWILCFINWRLTKANAFPKSIWHLSAVFCLSITTISMSGTGEIRDVWA